MTALDRALTEIAAGLDRTRGDLHAANVRLMLAERWRICRALDLAGPWPPEAGLAAALDRCRKMIAGESDRLAEVPGSGFGEGS